MPFIGENHTETKPYALCQTLFGSEHSCQMSVWDIAKPLMTNLCLPLPGR